MFESPILAFVTPSVGFLPAAFAPAYLIIARLKPAAVGSKNEPKAPSQSDRKPTLIVFAPPPSAASVCPPPPVSESSPPHPARPRATAAVPAASHLDALM